MTQGDGTTRTLSVRRIAVRDDSGSVAGSLIVGADVTDLYNTTKELRSLADSLEVRVADRTRALTEATNLASAVIRNTPIPIVVFDTKGKISVANDAALRLAQVDDTAGLDVLLTRQAADTVQAFRDLIACARHGRPRPPQEITFVTNDGEAATLLMSGAPLSADTGPDSGVVSSWINLTQERQANAEMRLWFQAFQQAGVGLALTQGARENAVIVGANQIAERMMRLPPRALIGKSPASIYFKEDIPRVLAAVRMADEGEHAAFESRVLRMDGTTFHAALTIDRVNLPDRAEPIRVCTLTDISDRKRVEAERDRWASAIEFAAFGIAIVDADTHQHLAANSAYADIHRRTVAETIGSPESTCFPAESLPMYNALIHDAAANGHAETNCPRLRNDGTTFPAWTAITSVHRPDVNLRYRIATVIDMTQYSRVEEQLRQAQKMEAIGNLTGGMAHDFNNLLGIIIGNLELAQAQSRDAGELQEYLAYATDAALSGAELIRRLLAFARRQPLRPERISLNQTVTNVARLLERLLGTDVRIAMNLTADIWPVITDASHIGAGPRRRTR